MRRKVAVALIGATLSLALPALAGPATLDAEQAALDREADQAFAANERLFREAEEVARRYKVDISAFRKERDELRRDRQEALLKGKRLDARVAEALLTSNAANTLEDILIDIPPGPEQQRYKQHVQQARASFAAFKASLAPSGK